MFYVLSAGSNIGDKSQNLSNAVDCLNNLPNTSVVSQSAIYKTEPVSDIEQDDFYNMVMLVKSNFNPHELLGACMGVESALGRVRTVKDGPRVIDLDIIFAQDLKIDTPNLVVPHPRYHQRRFVLQPMLDIFTDGNAFGINFSKYIDNIEGQRVIKI